MAVANDDPVDRRCAGDEVLSSFYAGRLHADALEAVARHVETCDRCLATLDSLAEPTDEFVLELRKPVQAPLLGAAEAARAAELAAAVRTEATVTVTKASDTPSECLPADGLPPTRLGQYELLEKLGEGGMGQVFKARHLLMGRVVAIKLIRAGLLADPEAQQRFQREIQVLSRLNHPNLVGAQYADQVEDIHFLVMEYVQGVTLSALVRRHGPLPIDEVCDSVKQVAEALDHAHSHRLVHRDLKPPNIMRTLAGQIKVLDLGLARLQEECGHDGDVTGTGQALGTADYMAPEQWDNSRTVDIRADLYSLGCTMYFLLTGRPPFSGPDYVNASRKMKAHLTGLVPPLHQARADVPAPVAAIVEKLLAKDPAGRFQTPAELVATLASIHGASPLSPSKKPGRKRLPIALAAASVALLLAGSLVWVSVSYLRHGDALVVIPVVPTEPVDAGKKQEAPPPAAELRVESVRASHYRDGKQIGYLGLNSLVTQFDDDVRIHARFSVPAYAYLIAFNADGKHQLCYPKDRATTPVKRADLEYPEIETNTFPLNDGIGLQAFVLAVSRQPLPTYAAWEAEHGTASWQAIEASGVWQLKDREFALLPTERGAERPRFKVPPALQKLAEFYRAHPGIDAVQILAFPVQAKTK